MRRRRDGRARGAAEQKKDAGTCPLVNEKGLIVSSRKQLDGKRLLRRKASQWNGEKKT